jgi:hypothetical protein
MTREEILDALMKLRADFDPDNAIDFAYWATEVIDKILTPNVTEVR